MRGVPSLPAGPVPLGEGPEEAEVERGHPQVPALGETGAAVGTTLLLQTQASLSLDFPGTCVVSAFTPTLPIIQPRGL